MIHANSLKKEGVKVRAMLALETSREVSVIPFLLWPFYPSTSDFIAVVGKLFQRKIVKTVRRAMQNATDAPRLLTGVALFDHLNYRWVGYPAAAITDMAFYRNPNYHFAFDTPDTLDY